MDEIPPAVEKLARTAWLPRVVEGDGDATASKVGGTAWIPAGGSHPVCPNCDRAMQLFLQLDVATLPEPATYGGRGLLQLFYCKSNKPSCDIDCEAYLPFSRSVVARRVDASAPGAPSTTVIDEPFDAMCIVAWEEIRDLPHPEELATYGVTFDEDDEWVEDLAETYPLAGEKLGGWPRWVQNVDYPSCPDCRAPMALVFQIDSNGVLDFSWGDLGTAHLTQCATHPDRLAFAWACY